jgi:hypothetical protein
LNLPAGELDTPVICLIHNFEKFFVTPNTSESRRHHSPPPVQDFDVWVIRIHPL